jgi:RimJ/RimL family protein N-acetyltransferase
VEQVIELQTNLLRMRGWRLADRAPFARLNADPEVMRWFPAVLSTEESDALVDRISRSLERDGFGLWAVEERSSGRFLGFTGLARPAFEAPFTPAVEIGWRFARDAWGKGFATEAARAVANLAFGDLGLAEIVSFTTAGNERSRAVMRRLHMTHDPDDDFDHPGLPDGHPLQRHVLYRLSGGQMTPAE